MTDPVDPPAPVWPYVERHTCTLRPSTDAAAVLDHGYTADCTDCGRPWAAVWAIQPGARDMQPVWTCTGSPPADWTPAPDEAEATP